MNRQQIENRLAAMEREAKMLRAELEKLKRPFWRGLNGDIIPFHEMDDQHLRNSLRVCVRMDPRYTFAAERMRSFAEMVIEAYERGIPTATWIEGE
jgi:hypothetical protein